MSETNNIRQRYLEDRAGASVVMATSLDKATLTTRSKSCQKTEKLDIICFSLPEKSIQVCFIFFPQFIEPSTSTEKFYLQLLKAYSFLQSKCVGD